MFRCRLDCTGRQASPKIRETRIDDYEIILKKAKVTESQLHVDDLKFDATSVVEAEAAQSNSSLQILSESVITIFKPFGVTVLVLLQEDKVVAFIKSMQPSSHYRVAVSWNHILCDVPLQNKCHFAAEVNFYSPLNST